MSRRILPKILPIPIGLCFLATIIFLLPQPVLADAPNLCSSPGRVIPDGGANDGTPGEALTDTITFAEGGTIQDLNVFISATHSFVGDLVFTLTHKVGAETSVTLVRRPGFSQPGVDACDGDNINLMLDDEAAPPLLVQTSCITHGQNNPPVSAYTSTHYIPASPLSEFEGESISGQWLLSVTDNYSVDVGVLNQWCLTASTPPDLVISQDDGIDRAVPGQIVIYTLAFSNTGGSGANGVAITETLPANTTFNPTLNPGWQQVGATNQYTTAIGNLAIDQTDTVTFAVTVAKPFPIGSTTITNIATIGDNGTRGPDQEAVDNLTSLNTFINTGPNLYLSKDDGGITVKPGDLIAYTLTYTNNGTENAAGVVITETLPLNSSFVASSNPPGWTQVGSTQQYTYPVGSLNTDETQSTQFIIKVNSTLPHGVDAITNIARIGGNSLFVAESTAVTPVNLFENLYLPLVLK